MRSLFWRILAAFWLALLLVAGLSILLGRALNRTPGSSPAILA